MQQLEVLLSFERLMREHDEIAILFDRLAALAKAEACQPDRASDALHELDGALTSHFVNEDELIYSRLLSRADLPAALAPPQLADNLAAIRQDWSEFRSEWTPECVAADLATFREETALVIARMRERVEAECRLLYPVALQAGMISLRDRRQ